ncbi:MAG: disulfide isomerase [Rubrivivax sp. SCN 70-15]|nr:MAG: disulfide isomerase [Rubrivivax sp. SCN 70-15]
MKTTLTVLAAGLLACSSVFAQEAVIRKSLAEHIPNFPKIDEVRPTPIPGLYEVRFAGSEIIYTDAKADARLDQLSAVDFSALQIKDAIAVKQGSGARRMAVFVDPNCPYCKRFERDMATVKDVTVYTFLMPILGPDSNVKARDIWCAKDPAKTWRDWMLDGVAPPKAAGKCDDGALERNVAFGQKYRITGTPTIFFENGTRKPGAIPAAAVEKLLAASAKKS